MPVVLALAAAGGLTAAEATAGADVPTARATSPDRPATTPTVMTLADGTRIGVTHLPGGHTSYRPLSASEGIGVWEHDDPTRDPVASDFIARLSDTLPGLERMPLITTAGS